MQVRKKSKTLNFHDYAHVSGEVVVEVEGPETIKTRE